MLIFVSIINRLFHELRRRSMRGLINCPKDAAIFDGGQAGRAGHRLIARRRRNLPGSPMPQQNLSVHPTYQIR